MAGRRTPGGALCASEGGVAALAAAGSQIATATSGRTSRSAPTREVRPRPTRTILLKSATAGSARRRTSRRRIAAAAADDGLPAMLFPPFVILDSHRPRAAAASVAIHRARRARVSVLPHNPSAAWPSAQFSRACARRSPGGVATGALSLRRFRGLALGARRFGGPLRFRPGRFCSGGAGVSVSGRGVSCGSPRDRRSRRSTPITATVIEPTTTLVGHPRNCARDWAFSGSTRRKRFPWPVERPAKGAAHQVRRNAQSCRNPCRPFASPRWRIRRTCTESGAWMNRPAKLATIADRTIVGRIRAPRPPGSGGVSRLLPSLTESPIAEISTLESQGHVERHARRRMSSSSAMRTSSAAVQHLVDEGVVPQQATPRLRRGARGGRSVSTAAGRRRPRAGPTDHVEADHAAERAASSGTCFPGRENDRAADSTSGDARYRLGEHRAALEVPRDGSAVRLQDEYPPVAPVVRRRSLPAPT